ncbi:MAG: 3,4-dehydroadipyl-CoA semialdehyde dehydrogenase [Planctomycetota bacterium]|nr:3,4-dehydroadipyl-CoA semialdehyde dehydrogenase [Planctomycetota bacterium]
MARRLASYVCGEWVEGKGSFVPLHNPTTEEFLAETSTEGVDFRACLEYARTRGNPSLRSLTFAQRGVLVGKLAKAIHEQREELIEISIASGGNTRGDAKFDIDGGTNTLAYYAKLGEKIGDRTFLLDGEPEQLSRNPRFVGRHIQTTLLGAAVHINAFNFPAWGFAEKAAVAILAGMPVISKPATSTSVLAHRIMEIVVEAGILPDGALQFICGGTGDLLDHLTCQDTLSFTGSGSTAELLRAGKAVIQNSVRANIEADSLNAAVLAPDVERESKTYDLFLIEVQREMTQKAGQKCTAVRRILVPEGMVEQVQEDLIQQIRTVKVGNPALKAVRMGPLATKRQQEDVTEGIERLRGVAEAIHGDGSRGDLVEVPDGVGYFVGPTLFRASQSDAPEIHGHEVFGPVQTILPYSGKPEDATRLVNLGAGGLVASLYTDKVDFAEPFVFGSAPFHGRLHIGSGKIADHSLGSGAVLPQMLHGGPGRAGGGEELAGLRGLSFYLQRTAVQGLKTLLEKFLPPE